MFMNFFFLGGGWVRAGGSRRDTLNIYVIHLNRVQSQTTKSYLLFLKHTLIFVLKITMATDLLLSSTQTHDKPSYPTILISKC